MVLMRRRSVRWFAGFSWQLMAVISGTNTSIHLSLHYLSLPQTLLEVIGVSLEAMSPVEEVLGEVTIA
jgi:hypothetical protein